MDSNIAVDTLGALAQETRLAVVKELVRAGEPGMCAGDIAKKLDVGPTTLTFHLKELLKCSLVIRRRQGRFIIYSLDFGQMRGLIDYLTSDCCMGHPDICGFPKNGESVASEKLDQTAA